MRTNSRHRAPGWLACGASGLALLTACAGAPQPSPAAVPALATPTAVSAPPARQFAPAAGAALAKLVPPAIAATGKIRVATDASDTANIPGEFVGDDGTTLTGLDIELAAAIGQRLGLAVEFHNVPAGNIEPGLQTGTYQLAMSSLPVTANRTALVDMVSYLNTGTMMAGPAANPARVGVDDLCGRAVGALQGSDQVAELVARGQACLNAGKPSVRTIALRETSELGLALLTKKVDAVLTDSLAVDYLAAVTNGLVMPIGQRYDVGPTGIATARNVPGLSAAIQATLRALIADGTYQAILRRWNAADAAVADPEISSSTSATR